MSEETKPPRKSVFNKVRSALAPAPVAEEPELPEISDAEQLDHPQPSSFAKGFFGALGVLVAIALSQAIATVQNIVVLTILAFVLALGASPLIMFLQRKMHKVVAMALVTVAVLSIVALGIVTVVPLLTQQVTLLARNLPRMLNNLLANRQIRNLNEQYGIIDKAQAALQANNIGHQVFNGVLGAGAVVVNFVFSFIITLVLTLYFIGSLDKIKHLVYSLAPASKRGSAKRIANQIFAGVSGYIQGMIIIVLLATCSAFVFVYFAGMREYAVALAFMHGLLCFIPVIGPPTGAVIITLVAFTVNPTTAIAAIIFFVLYQQLDAYVIYPRVMSHTVKVPGVLVILSALVGGILLGIIGALLAIPTAAALMLIFKEVVKPALDRR
ncbi:AI-2E family transporter [uncultured Tessaracoccus sp.]|uniref:AI-2E family transporter n=1 Tax=uncultured Tessaracoccus sp. TaxID=905023 RepID=UPI0026022D8E|nr:AI-2E family transporter [uncultured Tessaracoccus sp.]